MALKSEAVESGSGFVDNWQSGKSLAKCNLHMLTSEDSCDTYFRVGKEEKIIRAHRYVLISRSCVFHAMLCGPLAEKDEIKIPDVEVNVFKEFLNFLYTDISDPTPENVTSLLYMAKKYAVGGLERQCLGFFRVSLSPSNACVILEQSHLFEDKKLFDKAMAFILENGNKSLDDIQHLCHDCFHKVIGSDDLDAKPEQIFNAALLWATKCCESQGREATPTNLRAAIGETLYVLPFVDMAEERYVNMVLKERILTSEENVIIMESMRNPEKDSSPFKRKLIPSLKDCDPSSLPPTDVIFYDQDTQVTTAPYAVMTDRIDFRCSRDVFLCGLYLYRSRHSVGEKYTVHVQQYNKPRFMENSLYPTSVASEEHSYHATVVHLRDPLLIKAGFTYYVYVRRKGKGTPFVLGEERKSPTVKQCTFLLLPTGYIGGMNLIKGFIVRGLSDVL